MDLFSLKGRTAVVTGAGRGIGAAVVTLATLEGLDAHAAAVTRRLEDLP